MSMNDQNRILGFNGLRAISIILVYLSHKSGIGFHAGDIGVWTFFVISGYLIIGELHRRRVAIESRGDSIRVSLANFFIKRALRIFPAYYAVLVFLFVLQSHFRYAGPDLGFKYHFLYISNYWIGGIVKDGVGPFGVLWSLSVEQQFYVIAPFVFFLMPSARHTRFCLLIITMAAASHFAMYWAHIGKIGIHTMSPWNFAIMAMGGALHILNCSLRRSAIASENAAWFVTLVVGALAAEGSLYDVPNMYKPMFDLSLSGGLAYLVYWVATNQHTRVVKVLEWRPLEYLGTISYCFYLIHTFIPNPMGKVLTIYFGHTVPTYVKESVGAVIGFALTALVAHFSWRYFESPILRMKSKFLIQNQPAPQGQNDLQALGQCGPGHAMVTDIQYPVTVQAAGSASPSEHLSTSQ
jgi:peptidoglycan/LPS O-acetylase OafA/YrhL